MIEPILLDTGPIVAILYQKESQHERCVEHLRKLRVAPLTCWPVLTEAAHLLRRVGGKTNDLLRMVATDELRVAHLGRESAHWMGTFMDRYQSSDCDLADAAIMYLAETEQIETIFTLDRRHFSVYRTTQGKALRLLPEM